MADATARKARWKVFAPDTAGAIYGIIAAMAVIAGAASSPSHGKPLTLTVATLFVFWLAHVYAQALSHHLRGARRLEWSVVRTAMVEERPLIEGPVPLLVVLALGSLGVLDNHQAIRVALWLGVAELVTWGILYARRQRWRWLTALTAGAVNGLFGLLIVFLEVAVH
jgi:small neutral amino acid transporter SnatA (MarC family)